MGLGTKELATPKKLFNVNDTTNRAGMITHYIDLDIYTNGIHKEMRFLVSNIGKEDALLGYPWLATFEPRFSWKHGTIHTSYLPIILSSTNPRQRRDNVVAALRVEEKEAILQELNEQCGIRSAATKLTIAAGQHTTRVELPTEYQDFTSVFSEEEAK